MPTGFTTPPDEGRWLAFFDRELETVVRVIREDDPDWYVIFEIADVNGVREVCEIRVIPRPPSGSPEDAKLTTELARAWRPSARGRPLSARRLREMIQPTAALEFAHRAIRDEGSTYLVGRLTRRGIVDDRPAPSHPTTGPKGRRNDNAHLAWVASLYVAALGSRNPREEVAQKMRQSGWPNATGGQVREWLRAARDRQLLTPGQHGKAGGALTDRALAILEGDKT